MAVNPFFAEFEQNLANRGFTYGGGRISPDKKYLYVNIPKNASSYLDQLFSSNKWNIANTVTTDLTNLTPIVILRDPLDRWISGVTQYLYSLDIVPPNVSGANNLKGPTFLKSYNQLVEALLFDQIIFDDHTMPQYYFINELDISKTQFYMFNSSLSDNIKTRFNLNGITTNENRTSDNSAKQTILSFIKSKLDNNSKLVDKIKKQYIKDYELINQVKFYDPR